MLAGFPLTLPVCTSFYHVLLRQEKGWWWRREEEWRERTFHEGNCCSYIPSCHQPLLKTSTEVVLSSSTNSLLRDGTSALRRQCPMIFLVDNVCFQCPHSSLCYICIMLHTYGAVSHLLFVCCRLYRCCSRLFNATAVRWVEVKYIYIYMYVYSQAVIACCYTGQA